MEQSRSNKTICCPLCKEVSPVPSGGLKTIICNYFLADLVMRMDSIKVKSSLKGDKNRTEDIKFIELDPIYCENHPRNALDQYCADCDFAACGTCLFQNHSQHNLVDIAEQVKISNKELQHILKQTTTMIQLIDQQIDDSNTYDKQSLSDIKNIKKQINEIIDEMIEKLSLQRTQLFSSLDRIEQQREKVMMTVCDGSFVCNRHENKPSSHDMTVARVSIKADVMAIEGMGGHVRGSVAGSVSDKIVAKIPLVDQDPVYGLEVMGQTVWVVHYLKSSLHAYPMTSPHQPQTFSIQGLSEPMDMVRFPPGQTQLVISDLFKNQLLWVKVEQRDGEWRLSSQRSMKVSYDPWGLSVHDNQLLVCDRNIRLIHVLSTSGEET